MTSFICTLSIFVALMSTVYSIKCQQGWSINSETICSTIEVECSGSCITYSENCYIDNVYRPSIRKGCEAEQKLCNTIFSIKTDDLVEARVPTQCCETDSCNQEHTFQTSGIDGLPDANFQCPSCYVADSTVECESTKNVTCSVGQEQCLNYVGKVQLADASVIQMSLKGCITTGGCEGTFYVLPGSKQLKCNILECTPALQKI
ncbi:ly6/PLAUR domain-containing protein 8-like isoform X4 [Ascaphus truei]|uniref:ly6/PLAUR domain-containing protein 8-like isoform X4 n=1 Tax=Ascaphus truei TaxID=8439 RepID=UPI003F5908E2